MEAHEEQQGGKFVLAVDLGSGGPKVGLVDLEGRVVESCVRRTTTHLLPGGGAEQDPNEWWELISGAARQVIRLSGANPADVVAVSCTSQWSVTVALDENGEPLMNAVHWMDRRGGPYNRALMRGIPSVQGYGLRKLLRWIDLTSSAPTFSGVDALGHILFIKNERPDIYRKTWKFLEPMDYINLRLTGRCAATQHTTWPMMLADNRNSEVLEYHPWLLRTTGIERDKLPDLMPVDGTLGNLMPEIAAEWGLEGQTVVVASGNDNQTSAIGSGAIEDYEAVAVLGSSGYLSLHVPGKKTDIPHLIATLPSAVRGHYLVLAELGNNGKVLDTFLERFIYAGDEFGALEAGEERYVLAGRAAASAPPGSGGLLFLPWFNGSLSPQEDAQMRGGFLNLSHTTTRQHLARAVFEGTALNWRWLLGAVERFTKRRYDHWRLSGGGAQSDFWAQVMADVVGIAMHQQADPRNNNVLGAAFLAFNRLGLLDLREIPGKVRFARVYEPRQELRPLYDDLYRRFLESNRKLKPIFHALNHPAHGS
jgi:xylulokinase